MITVTKSIPDFETYKDTLGFSPENCLFFDIETTGFSPASSVVFLIGTLGREKNGWVLTQFLAENPQEEQAVLRTFLEKAACSDTLLHFNGSTFDLPYLIKKADCYGLAHTLESSASIDLYKKYRRFGKLFSLDRTNQTSLEAFAGWSRTDRLTGKHMVSLFQKYAASKESGLRELLLLHNHDDMLGMTHILSLTAYSLLFDGIFDGIWSAQCLPDFLQISFSLKKPVPTAIEVGDTYRLQAADSHAVLLIPFHTGTMYHFFPDYRNYYYLPLEDQAIHKSVAAYVDREYRTQARACNCYIKKSGQFLPQPEKLILPVFQPSFESSELCFAYSDDFLNDPDTQQAYLSAILRTFEKKKS